MNETNELLAETRRLLTERSNTQSLRQISEGAGVNYHWLSKFVQGKFDDPGVKKITSLHSYLKGACNGHDEPRC